MSPRRCGLRCTAAVWLGLMGVAVLGGCGPQPTPPPGEMPGDGAPMASTYEGLRAQGARLERGRVLSLSCVPCHSFGAEAPHSVGPNLYRVFGRAAGTRSGFAYSPALLGSGIVWSPATLDRWLAEPADFVPGTSMVFAGFAAAADRRDLIAYLLRETGGQSDRSAAAESGSRLDRTPDAGIGSDPRN